MSKKILALAILALMLFAVGCQPTNDNDSVEEKNDKGEFFFRAVVRTNDYTGYFLAEVIDSEVAFGEYRVNVGSNTTILGKNGESLTQKDLKSGDIIEIIFPGQVTMSIPPQISATRIEVVN